MDTPLRRRQRLTTRRARALILAGCAAGGGIAFLAAQALTFSVVVHVHDGNGLSPNDLDARDFEVQIDGRPRPIRAVRPAGPFSLLLLLDVSASMSRAVAHSELVEGVTALASQLRPSERLRVAAFNTSVEMGPDFGSTPAAISSFLAQLSYRNATRLYDGLDDSLAVMERQPDRGVIVVLSDGSDTDSRRTGDDVLMRARRSNIQVWALPPPERLRGVRGRGPDKSFMRIVQDTGGMFIQPKDTVNLTAFLSQVVTDLREQYALEVEVAALDRNVHGVAVRMKRTGLSLRAPRAGMIDLPLAKTGTSAPGMSPESPALVSPPEGAVLTFFPRVIDFEWTPVPGAARYRIEVDCYHCCVTDKWCADVNPSAVQTRDVTAPKSTIEFSGNQPGRWRVCAIDASGRLSAKSAWRQFTFYRPSAPAAAPPSFQDPATGHMISGPGVVGPKATYSPSPSYPPSALKDRMAGEVAMEGVVDENGRVQSVRVTRSLRADLDDSAVATLKTWRFEPARKDGQAVPARINVTMSFNVK